MTRRDFLRAVSATAAGAYIMPLEALSFSPTINWDQWNQVEYRFDSLQGVRGYVNSQEVTQWPQVMQQLCRYLAVDPDRGVIKLSPAGFGGLSRFELQIAKFGATEPMRFLCDDAYIEIPKLDSSDGFSFSCYLKADKETKPGRICVFGPNLTSNITDYEPRQS